MAKIDQAGSPHAKVTISRYGESITGELLSDHGSAHEYVRLYVDGVATEPMCIYNISALVEALRKASRSMV
jgi:hypothetical protein